MLTQHNAKSGTLYIPSSIDSSIPKKETFFHWFIHSCLHNIIQKSDNTIYTFLYWFIYPKNINFFCIDSFIHASQHNAKSDNTIYTFLYWFIYPKKINFFTLIHSFKLTQHNTKLDNTIYIYLHNHNAKKNQLNPLCLKPDPTYTYTHSSLY